MGLQSVAGGERSRGRVERVREGCGLCGFMGVCATCSAAIG